MKRTTTRIASMPIATLLWCATASAQFWPEAPVYPYENIETVKVEAQGFSDKLTRYIRAWAAGHAPAQIPDSIFKNVDLLQVGKVSLVNPDAQPAVRRWAIRPARPINFDSLESSYPDPHITYLLAPILAPFGAKVYVEGDFPQCRFFNFQISPPLDPRFYVYGRYNGSPEINIVDADIEPDPGHTNPFRAGADRTALNRHYHVTFDLAMGDAVVLNAQYSPPRFSSPGNNRVGSGFQYQGPWGLKDTTKWGNPPLFPYPAAGGGKWDYGFLWVRYYAMDHSVDALGGVALPKIYMQLSTGEKFWMQTDLSAYESIVNKTRPATVTAPVEPGTLEGPRVGWQKMFGVAVNGFEGFYKAWGWTRPEDKAHIRKLELGMTGRGETQPSIGGFEGSTTLCTYNTFLGRGMSLGSGKVIVLTGRMPTFPDTRPGATTMSAAQMRYWSITGMDADIFTAPAGVALNCVMDDEVKLDAQRRYVIAYSRPEDRPANATEAAGVTWVNWSPTACQGFMWRWNAVPDEWYIVDTTPNEVNLPRSSSSWSGTQFDSTLLGINGHGGFLGWYQPRVHYLTKAAFEALGPAVAADRVPVWGAGSPVAFAPQQAKPSRERTVAYNRFSGELGLHSVPKGAYQVEVFSLLGRSVTKVQVARIVGGSDNRIPVRWMRPGYYLARVLLRAGESSSTVVYPFVI